MDGMECGWLVMPFEFIKTYRVCSCFVNVSSLRSSLRSWYS